MSDAVFLTGASTGIGRATALRLAKAGVVVFAGVRRDVDGDALVRAAGPNVRPLLVEVTDGDSIARAYEAVDAASDVALRGVVNNAGVAVAGPLEILPDADLRRQFDINFFGALAVSRAFLPLLRKTRGRIVNISSIGGKTALPFVGAYAASKFALEAASDAMRIELAPFGVRVVLVEPGAIKTPIWNRSAGAIESLLATVPANAVEPYRTMIERMQALSAKMEAGGLEPDRVARTVERALFARRPRARYLVGNDARMQLVVGRMPEPIRDALFARLAGAHEVAATA